MESTPSSSINNNSPPKKRQRLDLGHLSISEKQYILNVYRCTRNDSPSPNPKSSKIVADVARIVGVANSTVYRVIKEYRGTGMISSSKHLGGRPAKVINYNENVKYVVRRIIHSIFLKNKNPTLDKILNEIHDVQNFNDVSTMSRSSLYKLIKHINFKYVTQNKKSVLIERDDIVLWRRRFLKSIKEYREEKRPIYYLDETWINEEGHVQAKVQWMDKAMKTNEDLSTGSQNPQGKGKRLIILHIGSDEGFVDGGLLIFEDKSKTTDNRDEMSAKQFEEWFDNILKQLPDQSVIVMDNAHYHSRKTEKITTTLSTKESMREWLSQKNIEFNEDMVRAELLHLIKQHRDKYDLYVVDEMAKSSGKTVLRLPPYHFELNAIELIWAKIQNEFASKNITFKLCDVKQYFLKAVKNVTSLNWKHCVNHTIQQEKEMWNLDEIMDDVIESLNISLGVEPSSSDDNDYE